MKICITLFGRQSMKNLFRIISLLLCAVLLLSLIPAASAATEKAVQIKSLKTEGFTVENFSGNTNYYLCYPESFEGIKFTEIKTNVSATVTISVERYCDYDYQLTYEIGEELYLGYGSNSTTYQELKAWYLKQAGVKDAQYDFERVSSIIKNEVIK